LKLCTLKSLSGRKEPESEEVVRAARLRLLQKNMDYEYLARAKEQDVETIIKPCENI
jgi:hypothetical protein